MSSASISRNYIYNLIYQVLVVVVPIVTTPYVSRVLGPSGVGAYSYSYAVAKYFIIFSNLGIATYGQLQIAANRNNRDSMSIIFYELFSLRLLLTALILLLYFIMVLLCSDYEQRVLYTIISIDIVAAGIDISWLLQGLEEFKKIVFRNLIIKFLSVILIFTCVKESSDLFVYASVLAISTVMGNASLWVYVRKYIDPFCLSKLKIWRHFRACVIYFIPTISTAIYLSLDKVMIGLFTDNPEENGFYEQAHKIEQIAVTLLTSLSLVTMPRIAFMFKEGRDYEIKAKLRSTIRFILFMAWPMALGMICVAKYFIPLFLGDGFEQSISLLKVFSLLFLIVGLNNAVGKQVLMPMLRQRAYNISVIVGAFANIVLNLILIPHFMSLGAAISSVASELCILILFIFFSRDYISVKEMLCGSWKYIISACVMSLAILVSFRVLSMSWLSVMLQVGLGAFIYLVTVAILRDDFVLHYLDRFTSRLSRKHDVI